MAKAIGSTYRQKSKTKRKVHSKNRSRTKGGKQYKKAYNKQGR